MLLPGSFGCVVPLLARLLLLILHCLLFYYYYYYHCNIFGSTNASHTNSIAPTSTCKKSDKFLYHTSSKAIIPTMGCRKKMVRSSSSREAGGRVQQGNTCTSVLIYFILTYLLTYKVLASSLPLSAAV